MVKRRSNEEDQIQKSIVSYIKTVHRQCIVFMINNGGNKNIKQAVNDKALGLLAGIPDLQLIAPNGKSIFIEVKTSSGKLSEPQKKIHPKIKDLGFSLYVVRSIDDVKELMEKEGIGIDLIGV